MADEDRPAKRIKINSDETGLSRNPPRDGVHTTHDSAIRASDRTGESQTSDAKSLAKPPSKVHKNGRRPQKGAENKNGKNSIRTFSQPSVICVGDKGVFVTSDKGCEKKALLELHGILQDYFETRGIDASGAPTVRDSSEALNATTTNPVKPDHDVPGGIEADIASELAELRNAGQTDAEATNTQSLKPMQLITLDIPCVSFLRLPLKTSVDPVEVVHRLCLEASDPNAPQRSRFIKRLTPISYLAKTLRQGLEAVSEEVLPQHFGPDENGEIKGVKFAIRPTVRENEQLDRDLIIKPVADRIQELGKAAHKVDLKQYEKGVIVEVYRGWIGMCVVDNTNAPSQQLGYESLRRFNISEIYAKR